MGGLLRFCRGGGLIALCCALGSSADVSAGDHAEAPALTNDLAGDIGDIYAWHTDGGNLVLALTWAGYGLRTDPAVYDADVLYSIHIDTNADNEPDTSIHARFGTNDAGDWGVQFVDLPGTTEPLEGPVETLLEADGIQAWAGLRDDPFFFDKEGYNDTLSTGTLSFDGTRDFAVLQNATALVVELPLTSIGDGAFSVWATTGRR